MNIQQRAPFFIEFVGLPGSGKSTISESVQSSICALQYKTVNRHISLADDKSSLCRHAVRSRYVLFGLLRTPRLFFRGAYLVLSGGQVTVFQYFKVIWNLWCVLGWYSWCRFRSSKAKVGIVDQGLIQAIWSIQLGALRTNVDWRGFVSDFGVSDLLLVIVRCDLGLAKQRLLNRKAGNSRMAAKSGAGDDKRWRHGEACLSTIMQDIEGVMAENVRIEVRNSENASLDDLARIIMDKLSLLNTMRT